MQLPHIFTAAVFTSATIALLMMVLAMYSAYALGMKVVVELMEDK